MNRGMIAAGLLAILMSTHELTAQQPKQQMPQDSTHRGMTMGIDMRQQMRVMDSMNARLDTLVLRMNRASGNAKVAAMAQVINEMVSQRRAMHAHMQQLMRSHGAMMGGHRSMEKDGDAPPSDSSGHAEHH